MKTKKRQVFAMKVSMLLFSVCLFQAAPLLSQSQSYDNFEGTKRVTYGARTGVLDTLAKNPSMNKVDSSTTCALYVRNGEKKFDNIKMSLKGNLSEVKTYATYLGIPPKIKMKVYTTAPVGTLVEILLGSKKGNNDYPAGTHSQYQAYTTVSGAWEELEFKFSQIPQGSETSADQVDQVTLLFNPNSSNSDTYYFDDLTGAPVVLDKVKKVNPTVDPSKADPAKKAAHK